MSKDRLRRYRRGHRSTERKQGSRTEGGTLCSATDLGCTDRSGDSVRCTLGRPRNTRSARWSCRRDRAENSRRSFGIARRCRAHRRKAVPPGNRRRPGRARGRCGSWDRRARSRRNPRPRRIRHSGARSCRNAYMGRPRNRRHPRIRRTESSRCRNAACSRGSRCLCGKAARTRPPPRGRRPRRPVCPARRAMRRRPSSHRSPGRPPRRNPARGTRTGASRCRRRAPQKKGGSHEGSQPGKPGTNDTTPHGLLATMPSATSRANPSG